MAITSPLFSPASFSSLTSSSFSSGQDLSFWSSLSHSLSLSPFLSQPKILLSLCLSLRLKTFQFSCHKLCSPAQLSKQGGVPFIPPHILRKGDGREEGFNARVWTQAIISNYCFSFQFPCPDGGLTRRTCNNPLQSSRISGPSESRLGLGTLWLSSQCESGVDSNMEWWEN